MKQRARVLVGYTQPEDKEKRGGYSIKHLLEIEQDMGFTVLGRQDLERLGKVEDMYLLQELRDRGYSVSVLKRPTEEVVLESMEVFHMVEYLYDFLKKQQELTLRDFMTRFLAYAFSRENTQRAVAKALGVSPRMANYYHTKVIKNGGMLENRILLAEENGNEVSDD